MLKSDERREMMLNKHSREYKSLSQPMGIIHSHFYSQKDTMAYSFRRVASDNAKSNQLQCCKALTAGVTDRKALLYLNS